MADFTSVPVLDWNLIASGNKAQFLKELQHALINVGFLYLDHPPVDPVGLAFCERNIVLNRRINIGTHQETGGVCPKGIRNFAAGEGCVWNGEL